MSKKAPYKNFENFVLRTPIFPLNFYEEVTKETFISKKTLSNYFKDPIISEAIYLASPSLHILLQRHFNNELTDKKKIERLENSFLKYLTRMSTRPTPFGLFSGCTVGHLSSENFAMVKEVRYNNRHTRLDMNFLVHFAIELVKIPSIRNQLLFFPNNSIYQTGRQLRYVEYEYKSTKRNHKIVAVSCSDHLSTILVSSKKGMTIKALRDLLVSENISVVESESYINQLIDNQILISELEPTLTGLEFFERLYQVLKKTSCVNDIISILDSIRKKLLSLDKRLGNSVEKYQEIIKDLKVLNPNIEPKYLFQTDLILDSVIMKLDGSIVNSVMKGLKILNKLSFAPTNSYLTKFKEAFIERFGEREVSLSKVLDVEIGIGYKQNIEKKAVNPLVDDLSFEEKEPISEIQPSKINSVLYQLITSHLFKGKYILDLDEFQERFQIFEENWDDLPDTISTVVQKINVDGKEKLKFGGFIGSGAANFLGRFCHGDKRMEEYVETILAKEKFINNNEILAEIVHLPKARVGNVISRKVLRDYEIPYLALSTINMDNQIPIEDLTLSVRKNRLILKSKKLNKEVKPRLTNAHNFSSGQLPIYHFLCDMQIESERKGLWLDLSPLKDYFKFLPRIEYKNLILFEATWHFEFNEIDYLYAISKADLLLKEIKEIKRINKMPKLVTLVKGDNQLVVNLENYTSIKMFLETVKSERKFTIKEFLGGHHFKKNKGETRLEYVNELIISFYKQTKNNLKNG